MRNVWNFAAGAALAAALASGTGCGSKDEPAPPAGASTPAAPAKTEPPTKDAVAAIDCKAAVDKDVECIKASGINTATYGDNWVKDMVQGCETIKSTYDPAKDISVKAVLK